MKQHRGMRHLIKSVFITLLLCNNSLLHAATSTTATNDSEVIATAKANDVDVKPAATTTTTTTTSETTDTSISTANDPFEPFNRAMFTFNDKLDKYLLKPVATFYNKIMPKPLNEGINNVFNNLNTVTIIANDVLQFNFHQAANDTWRLVINTTVGIGGIFDIATRIKLARYKNDFGMTMARWGYRNSNYIVLPFFGANTIRDGIGIPVDYFAFSVYPYIQPESTRYEIYGLGVIDARAQLLRYQDVMDEAAVDRYVFVRDAYLQHRNHQIVENDHRSYRDVGAPVEAAATASADDTGPAAIVSDSTNPTATVSDANTVTVKAVASAIKTVHYPESTVQSG